MAYRRRQGMARSSTFKEDRYSPSEYGDRAAPNSPSSSLAAQAIMASAAHRDSSHSSAYAPSGFKDHAVGGRTYDYTSMGSSNETGSFWGVLSRKAKAIIEDDNELYQPEYHSPRTPDTVYSSRADQVDISKKLDNPTLRKGLDALTSSMNRIGDTIGNALEEGRTIVENKTADFIQETRKIQIIRKGSNEGQTANPTSQEDQLKASRDVAMATAAKAKLLLRELKTLKADLTFAKERCSQLEDENRILRDAREKGVHTADDDMIRLQLETLLAEKARLAHENSVYARENRFLREVVEYHQLTMQDVVYLDEGIEEVTEVYPIPAVARRLSVSPPSTLSPLSSSEFCLPRSSSVPKDILRSPAPLPRRDRA